MVKHTIDLQNYNLRTDLALEELENRKINNNEKIKKEIIDDIKIETVIIDENDSKLIDKKNGKYTTISFNDTTDTNNRDNIKKVFLKVLKDYIGNFKKDDLILVVGLGNRLSTPDALGPKIVDMIVVTNHLYELNLCSNEYQKVAAIAPSVTGKTGIETFKQIKSIVKELKPKLVIAIDSLASSSIDRVNKTIQVTDTGINPGSGVGNERKEISVDTLGVPVLAIGVPTVVDATSIVFDTINYIYQKYSFSKYNMCNKKYLLTYNNINYLSDEIKLKEEDKELLLGLVGKLSNNELKTLIYEVLTPIGYNLIVTPKEVDFIIENLVEIIGKSLNDFFSS